VSKADHSIPADSPLPEGDSSAPTFPLLDRVKSPQDLWKLDRSELVPLCAEVRAFLLDSVQRTGGHLGSNLGTVELTVALHRVFDFRRDRVVWDVSHQAYTHKLLTGRREGFASLRQTDGMCGFTNPSESEYDLFHTGHAGTSIALGLGLAAGTAHESPRPHVVSLIGDASLGAGVAFEALNHAGASGERLLVILNDNEWSISRSVGALARYLTRIRSARVVQRAQQEVHGLLQSIPLIGNKVESVLDQVREVLRHSFVQGHVFEELGVTYVGPVNGHDIDYLVEQLERVRELEGVVLLHALTEKGKGHPNAPTHPERVHAAKPNSHPKPGKVEQVKASSLAQGPSYTAAFGRALQRVAEGDLRVHVITAGMPSGTGLTDFAERFPTRFHDVGICEQLGIALAAGMAKSGLRPVVAIYSTFLQRGYDQVFQEVVLQGLPVTFCMDRAGLVGQDGPTHNGVFDLAYLRVFPGMVLAAPRDASDLDRMLGMAVDASGPVALRYPRSNSPVEETLPVDEREPMVPGKAEVLAEAGDGVQVVIWALGAIVAEAQRAATLLAERGIRVGLVDARFAKPLDEDLLAEHVRDHDLVLTLEEHQRTGGFGSAVLEVVSRIPRARARVRIMGIPDRFIDHMTGRGEQLRVAGIDAEAVVQAVLQSMQASRV